VEGLEVLTGEAVPREGREFDTVANVFNADSDDVVSGSDDNILDVDVDVEVDTDIDDIVDDGLNGGAT
jgi:hypothetical protein